jgi:hypothetical protein
LYLIEFFRFQPEKVKKIIDADSPYLNIKSSSVGLSPLFAVKSSASIKSGSVVAQSTTTVSTTEVTKPKVPRNAEILIEHSNSVCFYSPVLHLPVIEVNHENNDL